MLRNSKLANDDHSDALRGTSFKLLQRKVYQLTGIDLSLYKEKQVKRLLESARRRYNADTFGELLKRLEQDDLLLDKFKSRLSINVSEFFRDAARFEYFADNILPEVLNENSTPSFWSAGCSVGCEPYTLAILLAEEQHLDKSIIIASDIDEEAVARAETALYWESEIRGVNDYLRAKYFNHLESVSENEIPEPSRRTSDGKLEDLYQVKKDVREVVEFKIEDLFNCKYKSEFDLIVCRNVTIYFTEAAKKTLYEQLTEALKPGGYLFVGGTEIIFQAEELGIENPAPFFYRRLK